MREIKLKGLNETIYEHITKEGLRVYMWANEKVNSAYYSLSVKYGSVDTKFKVGKKIYEVPNGVAHFLEHVKFNYSKDKTAHDIFYKLGADANAFTTFNYTSYIVFSTDKKVEILNTLLDFVYKPYFTSRMISKEKGIIVEEANMGIDDAYSDCYYHSLQNIFQKSKYRNLITGKQTEIKSITLDDIKLAYDLFYHPKNMFLCITGNINPYEMAKVVDENLSKKEFSKYNNPQVIKEEEPRKVNKKYDEYYCNLTYPRIKYAIKLPISKFKNIDLVDLRIITNLILNINLGETSLFKEELMDNKLITGMYYNNDIFDDYFVITITVSTKYHEEVIKKIENKLNNLEITKEELIRKRNAQVAAMILNFDDIEVVNSSLQDDIMLEDKIIDDIKIRLSNYKLNDLEKIMSLIKLDNVSVSVFLPNKNPEE